MILETTPMMPPTFPLPTRAQVSDVVRTLQLATSSFSNGVSFASAALNTPAHFPSAVQYAGEGAGLLRGAAAVIVGIAPQFGMLSSNLAMSAERVLAAASRPAASPDLVAALAAAKGDATAAASALAAIPTA